MILRDKLISLLTPHKFLIDFKEMADTECTTHATIDLRLSGKDESVSEFTKLEDNDKEEEEEEESDDEEGTKRL